MKVCVVIPTYNERGNISKLIESILSVFKSIKKFEIDILVADDNSPDGTGKIVQNYTKLHSNVHLLTGEKKGLGAAYMRGFRYAVNNFDVIVMMDADLSHNPKIIPKLLEEIRNGYDLVIGSRYISGGSTPDWNILRKLISRGGNLFARLVGGLYKVHDCTSGFRAIRADLLKKIDFKYLATRGYAFQATLLYELNMSGAKIKEIPITFYDRRFGETKLTKRDIIEFFLNSCRLRLRTGERLAKFVTVGFLGFIFNTFLLWLLTQKFDLYYIFSAAIAIESAIIFNFIFNDIYTFRDNIDHSNYFIRMLKFNGVALYGFVINLSVFYLLTRYTGMYFLFSNIIGIFIATAWNYIAVLDYTWRVKSVVYYTRKTYSLIRLKIDN